MLECVFQNLFAFNDHFSVFISMYFIILSIHNYKTGKHTLGDFKGTSNTKSRVSPRVLASIPTNFVNFHPEFKKKIEFEH